MIEYGICRRCGEWGELMGGLCEECRAREEEAEELI